jgi:succinoglycan biosynthesis protein ExoA
MNVVADPEISIVVACRNEAAHIGAFLDSLVEQDLRGVDWEAIIADGMSDDGTLEILDAYSARHLELRVLANPGRIVSTGLNAAIRAARGAIILRMDAHTRYAPDYCQSCVDTLQRTGADNVGGPARTEARGLRAQAIAAAYHSRFSTGGAKFHDVDYEGWVDTVPYGCWRKSTLERIGFFDENLVRNQDDELNLRLLRAGGKIWQSPEIVSWYSPRSKLSDLFRQYLQYGFWKVAVTRKHRIPGSWRHIVPVVFILFNTILLAGVAIAVISGAAGWVALFAATWLVVISAYAGANLTASVCAARRHGWATLPFLPAAFAVFHVAYGMGFFAGLFRFAMASAGRPFAPDSAFVRTTR